MVEWPFYGVFCDLQRSGMKRSRVESHGHQMFVLLCLQNQKTVALLPKSLLLDPRFPVFLQGFLASYPPWWNQNCQRQTSKKSAKSGEISPTRKDGAKNLSFCYMDKLPFFCSVHSPRNFETCHQTGCSNPRLKTNHRSKKNRWLIIFFFWSPLRWWSKTSPKKRTYRKKTAKEMVSKGRKSFENSWCFRTFATKCEQIPKPIWFRVLSFYTESRVGGDQPDVRKH